MRSYSIAACVLLACLAGCDTAVAACQPMAAVRASIAGDFAAALEQEKTCYWEHGQHPEWLEQQAAGYHLAAASQIAAAMGKLGEAADLLAKASTIFADNNQTLLHSDEVEIVSRGYLLEMAGRLDEAEQFYLAHQDANTMARLAVMAMNREDKASAVDWASKAMHADATNLTARIVLAATTDAPLNGITERLLREAGSDTSHDFMPAHYAEVWWAKAWLEKAGKIGRPPLRER